MIPDGPRDHTSDAHDVRIVEAIVARVLFWGGVLGIALMLGGLVAYTVGNGTHGALFDTARVQENRTQGRSAQTFSSLPAVRQGLTHRPVDPLAVATLGLLVLIMTPVAGVAVAIPAFLLARDVRYATIAAIVLTALVVSFALSAGG